MIKFHIKQGSTSPSAVRTLPVDLNKKTVEFRMADLNLKSVVKRQAVIESVEEGRVRFDWKPGDTDTSGSHWAEWAVKGNNDVIDVFPEDGYDEIYIVPNLDK